MRHSSISVFFCISIKLIRCYISVTLLLLKLEHPLSIMAPPPICLTCLFLYFCISIKLEHRLSAYHLWQHHQFLLPILITYCFALMLRIIPMSFTWISFFFLFWRWYIYFFSCVRCTWASICCFFGCSSAFCCKMHTLILPLDAVF